ncbi:MAG: heterodisulfide reductase-related iron-sulfur binding cluster [Actinomycetota bacterium]
MIWAAAADPISRPVFYSLPLWLIITFYVVSAATLIVFFVAAARKVRRYRLGRKDPADRPALRRLPGALLGVFTNRGILKGNWYAGLAHLAVFWGFVGLFVATILVLVDNDILHPLIPQWTFMKGEFYLVFAWLADFSGLLLVTGLALFAFRRLALRPRELQVEGRDDVAFPRPRLVRWEDWAFLTLLLVAGLGGFFLEALRIRATDPSFEGVSFVGWLLNGWLGDAGVTAGGADGAFAYLWVFHALSALVLIAFIPTSKAWHMLAGWYSLAVKPERLGEFPKVIPSAGGGYGRLEDLSRGELATLDACIRCGRCHIACPAAEGGFPLSPRDLILALQVNARRLLPGPHPAPGTAATAPALAGGLIPASWLWSCTSCLACDEVCPLGIQHLPLILQMRRDLVARGEIDDKVQETLTSVMRYGNSLGQSPRNRARWVKELPFEIKDARKEPVEYLWFVGDYASFDPRAQAVTLATARVFRAAGLDFGILYEAELNAGTDVRRVGEEGLFEMQRDKNVAALTSSQHQAIVTTDPHSYHALRREYGSLDGDGGIPVLHHTEVLSALLRDGALRVEAPLAGSLTYHDPCYPGRYGRVFDAPRRVLEALGARLQEMPRNRERAFCCGAGGGRIWMEDVPGVKERPAESRVREAAGLEGVGTMVVACPKDLVMFRDALKTTGLEGVLAVRDIVELVEDAIGATQRSEA